jgi:zinc/manganese transport system substrate-binding protein
MTRSWRRPRIAAVIALMLIGCLVGCGSKQNAQLRSTSSSGATTVPGASSPPPPCPGAPVDVAVSVDQWGDLVSQLGGACAVVKTVLVSSTVDPHDYEPSPHDAAVFSGARAIVINGAGYDPWALKLAAISAPLAPVVSAAEVTKTPDGANPHLWYSPSAVTAVADALTAELSKLDPQTRDYFTQRRKALDTAMQPYTHLIDTIKAHAAGKTYGATEGIFTYMADALGLVNVTPQGYRRAAAGESDPPPADLKAFLDELAGHRIDVLIYNPQTEGSIPDQIRAAAEQAGVPVVIATETVPQDQTSFAGWQDAQLTALAKALRVQL